MPEKIGMSRRSLRGSIAGCAAALLFLLCASAQEQKGAERSDALTLDARLTIVVAAGEPEPVRLAANDLADDFQKVFGIRPKIAGQAGSDRSDAATVLIGEAAMLPRDRRPAQAGAPESFSIAVSGSDLVLAGADMRGAIYAIYQFSQEYLGVDPMYYWTDHQPPRRERIELPRTLRKAYPAPAFKYRGFFINDEDLLTGWAPGSMNPAGERTGARSGISLEAWNKVYETILRLKGNMVVPGTWIFPDDAQIQAAAARGLIVTQHHAIPLGLNVARWPKDVPYNYTTPPEILQRAWKDAVAAYPKNAEVLWAVGLRGLSDVTYASMDPAVQNNDKALGALIGKAIQDQMRIVRAVRPDARFVTDLWQEGARLEQEGYLKIPPEVMTVWADDGYGYIQDKGEVAAGQGAYYHVAMMNFRSNQLTEMVPIERIAGELGRMVKAGATNYLLVNTSDIRPYALTTRAAMDIAWLGHLPGAEGAPSGYYRRWAEEEFGGGAAPVLADVYKEYFAAPAHFGDPPEPPREYGDQLYHTEGRQMMQTWMIDSPLYSLPSQSPKWEMPRLVGEGYGPAGVAGKAWLAATAAREIRQCGDAQPRWDAVWSKAAAAESLIPPARREFFQSSVLTMIAINRESNRMLLEIAESIRDAQAGKMPAAQREAAEALAAVAEVRKAQAAAEYGKWRNWYRGDWLTGVYRTQQVLVDYAAFLKDPLAHLPPPILWNGWEAYYHILWYQGDRSVDVR